MRETRRSLLEMQIKPLSQGMARLISEVYERIEIGMRTSITGSFHLSVISILSLIHHDIQPYPCFG